MRTWVKVTIGSRADRRRVRRRWRAPARTSSFATWMSGPAPRPTQPRRLTSSRRGLDSGRRSSRSWIPHSATFRIYRPADAEHDACRHGPCHQLRDLPSTSATFRFADAVRTVNLVSAPRIAPEISADHRHIERYAHASSPLHVTGRVPRVRFGLSRYCSVTHAQTRTIPIPPTTISTTSTRSRAPTSSRL